MEALEASYLIINKNDRKLKYLGSPKDKLTLERRRKKEKTKRGCSDRCYHTSESASELGRGLCLAMFNSRGTVRGKMF